jgi:hypothetical protein
LQSIATLVRSAHPNASSSPASIIKSALGPSVVLL